MRKALLAAILFSLTAISAMAGQPFVALVDAERGLVLIPDGTAVPRGVDFYLDPEIVPMAQTPDSVLETSAPRRLVWAYADDDARFVAARKRIAETQPLESSAMTILQDEWFYFTFEDGSYHGARKFVRQDSPSNYTYAVATLVHDVGGDYDARVTASQSSTTHTGFNVSRSCNFYAAAGTCSTPTYGYGGWASFTASVSSKGSIVRYLYPPCDYPCKQNRQSTIVISFP